jgi:hypothetical protein
MPMNKKIDITEYSACIREDIPVCFFDTDEDVVVIQREFLMMMLDLASLSDEQLHEKYELFVIAAMRRNLQSLLMQHKVMLQMLVKTTQSEGKVN